MLQIGVPVVLAVVVRPAKEGLGDASPPRLEDSPAQIENPILYCVPLRLDLIRIEVVLPALSDLLPASVVHGLRDDVPILRTVLDHQSDQHHVLIEGPSSLE